MVLRSRSATLDGIELINLAITEKGWSREDLAKHCDCSRQPSVKFCSGKNVSNKLFVSFCKALDLDWEVIAGIKKDEVNSNSALIEADMNALLSNICQQIESDIEHRCGIMRVLDMEQPIGIDELYTNVNILEKLSGRQRLSITELGQNYNTENCHRFALGQVRYEHVPGLEVVSRFKKLMIFGKPGSGKTTFLKRLATLCNKGKFKVDCVPIFVTLKEFSEVNGHPNLYDYIAKQWQICGLHESDLARVISQGNALILLDGLDEVQELDRCQTVQSIKVFTQQFRNCQFVVTCRIAAREYTFEQFTEVEIADFNEKQIEEFAVKWFIAKEDSEKVNNFIQQLKDNQPIQELATNPLLLTLLCLVFGEANNFPCNRSELYKEGLDILLKKWDAKRNIERDQVYKKLSLKRKEDLLSQLAYQTFKRGDYFIKQNIIERQIIEYISNLPSATEDETVLQLDSEAVLKSIEAQHGLLVERAKGIYSFSHLTLQEYFAAKYITSPTSQFRVDLEDLASHCLDKRYREVFLLVLGILPEADDFIKLIKQQVDQILTDDPRLQDFLSWVSIKSKMINVDYKPEAIRAFYLALALARTIDSDFVIAFDLDVERQQAWDIAITRVVDLELDSGRVVALDRDLALARAIDLAVARALDLSRDSTLAFDLALVLALDRALDLDLALVLALDLALVLDLSFDHKTVLELKNASNSEIRNKLKKLKAQIPDLQDIQTFKNWWRNEGELWTENLREAMITYCNLGHDWQFTCTQEEKLRQYYDANQLLVDCLNSDCYITKKTRQEIESTLLLPLSELNRKKNSTNLIMCENSYDSA